MTDFNQATTAGSVGPGKFRATIPEGWQQGRGAFGGLTVFVSLAGPSGALPPVPRKEPRVLALFQAAIDKWNEGKAHEQLVHRFAVLPQDLTIESGELTPTLKVKRKVVTQKYKAILDAFYVE